MLTAEQLRQLLATNEHMLLVHPSLPVKSVKELIALAKQNPGKYSIGGIVSGRGGGSTSSSSALKSAFGVFAAAGLLAFVAGFVTLSSNQKIAGDS